MSGPRAAALGLAWAWACACAHGNPPPRVVERAPAAETIGVAPAGAPLTPSTPEELREAALGLQRLLAAAAEDCYDRALRRAEKRAEDESKPQDAATAQGVVVVAFTVGAGGEVGGAHVSESEVALEGLDECLVGLFAAMRLQARGPEEVEMPFRFALKGGD